MSKCTVFIPKINNKSLNVLQLTFALYVLPQVSLLHNRNILFRNKLQENILL